jgi:Ran GTPase-activating protein (RanGAP) involved in mRNA processing and transport
VDGTERFADVLRSNPQLQKINLGCKYHYLSIILHPSSLLICTCNPFFFFFLVVNAIGDEGTSQLAKALVSNTHLKSLYLACNGIGKDGAYHLAEYVAQTTTLEELRLGCKSCHSDFFFFPTFFFLLFIFNQLTHLETKERSLWQRQSSEIPR